MESITSEELPMWCIVIAIIAWECLCGAFITLIISTILRRFLGLRVVGLTGGVSTGKSTCSFYLKENVNLPIVDFDEITHDIYACGKSAWSRIRAEFGDEMLIMTNDAKWTIDRQKLANIVWNDRKELSKLMKITRWPICKEFLIQLLMNILEGRMQILDCPLLIEQKWILYLLVDSVVLVYCDKSTQIKRLMERDNITTNEALRKLEKQMDIDKKKTYVSRGSGNTIIDNCDSLKVTQKQLHSFVSKSHQLEGLGEYCSWKRAIRPTKFSLWISAAIYIAGFLSHWIVIMMPPRW